MGCLRSTEMAHAATLAHRCSASGTSGGEPEPEEGELTITIYHDLDHSAGAVSRYEEAEGLLEAARRQYVVVSGPVADDVDRLAGVSGSEIPRFLLGDATANDWVSKPRTSTSRRHLCAGGRPACSPGRKAGGRRCFAMPGGSGGTQGGRRTCLSPRSVGGYDGCHIAGTAVTDFMEVRAAGRRARLGNSTAVRLGWNAGIRFRTGHRRHGGGDGEMV